MKRKIYFSLRTQFSNMGDLLINHLLLEELVKIGDVCLDVTGVPDWYLQLVLGEKNRKVDLCSRYQYCVKLFRGLIVGRKKHVSFIILKPGGYMAISSWKMLLARLCQGFFLKLVSKLGGLILRAPSSQKNSICILGFVDKFRFSSVKYHMIRDDVSLVEMKKIGFEGIRSYDMASLLFIDDYKKNNFVAKKIKSQSKKLVVFSFRERKEINNIEWNLLSTAIIEKGLTCSVISQVYSDNNFNMAVSKSIDANYTEYKGSDESLSAVINKYVNAKYVVSNRLHVLMIGIANGAIPIAVISGADIKVSAYMERMGCRDNIIFCEELAPSSIIHVLERAKNCELGFMANQGRMLKEQFSRVLLDGQI